MLICQKALYEVFEAKQIPYEALDVEQPLVLPEHLFHSFFTLSWARQNAKKVDVRVDHL